ncbi:MAG: glycosyltransferase family 2 protein [Muribaculaceae bacterium]|nr:glycosyltransferase family 2 protein [Muribaculaceae bacterium]
MICRYAITVFTPTYNRAHTLPRLYESLVRQATPELFEWLIIDDGSTDDTESVVNEWIGEGIIHIHYVKTENGGKPRAINNAVGYARSPYLFIVDSDDFLVDDAIEFMVAKCNEVRCEQNIAGVGCLQGDKNKIAKKKVLITDYVDATNLQRSKYGLDVDCNEAYKIDILRRYPFYVWPGETFVPEEIVLNEMALDGYIIRWHNKVNVISEYLDGGLTKSSWQLVRKNPMGYAMLYEHKLKFERSLQRKIYNTLQMIAQSILGHNPEFPFRGKHKLLAIMCFPIGALLAVRRKYQYRHL